DTEFASPSFLFADRHSCVPGTSWFRVTLFITGVSMASRHFPGNTDPGRFTGGDGSINKLFLRSIKGLCGP
ncbi:hypothetical protein NDU88_002165, partial [Pleurodeles waltl]